MMIGALNCAPCRPPLALPNGHPTLNPSLPQIPRAQWARLVRRIGYVPMWIWGWCFSFMPKKVRL